MMPRHRVRFTALLVVAAFAVSCAQGPVSTVANVPEEPPVAPQGPLSEEEFRAALEESLRPGGGLDQFQTLGGLVDRYLANLPALPEETEPYEDLLTLDEEIESGPVTGIPLANPECADLGKVKYDVPVVFNTYVAQYLRNFTTRRRATIQRALLRSGRYVPKMKEILRQHGMPEDLWCLVIIESSFRPRVTSPAHARGLWQFIPSTGRRYGMEIDWWKDERCDPVKATVAAANYLHTLYCMFGDWHLALASYNCGEGRVMRAMKRHNTNDYWTLVRKRALPRETRNYVPAFLAAVKIANSPERYGFTFEGQEAPMSYDTIVLEDSTDLHLVAKCAGVTFEEIKDLNPELNQWCTPPNEKYFLRLPQGASNRFYAAFRQAPKSRKPTWRQHVVRRGESLGLIASRSGSSVRAIMAANNLRNPNLLSIGQTLMIPSGPRFSVVSESNAKAKSSPIVRASRTTTPPAAPRKATVSKRYHTVRPGESPGVIAQGHGMDLRDFLKLNGLHTRSIIYPGQRLKVERGAAKASKAPARGKTSYVVYRVRSGDTLSEIAERHGVSVRQIMAWNGLRSASRLSIGQRLKMTVKSDSPKGYVASAGAVVPEVVQAPLPSNARNVNEVTYTVRSGDSLWKLSQRYKVSVRQLKEWNGLSSNHLDIGQQLVVYRR